MLCAHAAMAQSGLQLPELIAAALPAVVNITTFSYDIAGPSAGNMDAQSIASEHKNESTGFLTDPGGVIVTNKHSIADANDILVTLYDSTVLRACVLAVATQSDIALLRINAGRELPTLSFGRSVRLRPGETVSVIGNPLGLGSTVTSGIVSARNRNTSQSGFGSFIQIDAAINHGSSGGPVLGADGEVVGVATALYAPGAETGSVGLGLAIPADDAKFVAERLFAEGRVRLGWIGAHVQPMTIDLAAAEKLSDPSGSIVTDLEANGPAGNAGLAVGDIIQQLAGGAANSAEALNHAVAVAPIGSTVKLIVWRAGEQLTIPVVVAESPADQPSPKLPASIACHTTPTESHHLGLSTGSLTADVRAKLGIAETTAGVAIREVRANSPAADRGFVTGSVLLNVNGREIDSPADVEASIDKARADKLDWIMMLVRDTQGLRWVALPLH
jgi:serine protease Do